MDVINREECEPFVTKDTSEIREIMAYRNSACKNISLAEATIYPDRSTEPHYHDESEEIYYFLSGSGHMQLGDEELDVGPGDAVFIPPGTVHQTWNTGNEKLVFLCLCAPPYEHEDTELVDG